jgi:soluble lytic murein transglycosylase-like protein/TolA-binding protein
MKKTLTLAVITLAACTSSPTQSVNDSALRKITDRDQQGRSANGTIPDLSAAEHLQRAETYSSNRLFPQAREHWQKFLDRFPTDPGVPRALFGIGRSYMWEREYETALDYLQRVAREFPETKYGQEGLAFSGACNVRLGRNLDAATLYERYINVYPAGDRLESAHLNLIDAYREAGKYDEAVEWVSRTRQRFNGKPAETNALHARLRMEIYRQNWVEAVRAADELLALRSFSGSMAGTDEVKYLKAFSLEKAGRKPESASLFASLAQTTGSYYGGLAAERLNPRGTLVKSTASTVRNLDEYPVVYRDQLIKNARTRKIDPRFLLAIMKQESSFKPNAKSPAAARGLLQLVYDTALKYRTKAGYPLLEPDDLYTPAINIAVGSVYIGELRDEFGGLYEAIAASYNGGEDNAARWLNRTKPRDPGLFAAEIGFAETKGYVFKVMNNYRAYRDLYTEDLRRR